MGLLLLRLLELLGGGILYRLLSRLLCRMLLNWLLLSRLLLDRLIRRLLYRLLLELLTLRSGLRWNLRARLLTVISEGGDLKADGRKRHILSVGLLHLLGILLSQLGHVGRLFASEKSTRRGIVTELLRKRLRRRKLLTRVLIDRLRLLTVLGLLWIERMLTHGRSRLFRSLQSVQGADI